MNERERFPASWGVLALLVLLAPLVQGGTPRLPAMAVNLGLLGAFVAWARSWRREPHQSLHLTATDALLALLIFWALFSTLTAPYYFAAEQSLLPLGCFVLGYWGLAFRPSFRGWAVAAGAVRIQALGQSLLVLGQRFALGEERPAGTFLNPNFLAGFLAVALLLSLGAVVFPAARRGGRPGGGWGARGLRLAEAAPVLAALLLTGSRGGLLALVAGLAVLVGLRSVRALAIGVVAAAAILLLVPNPVSYRLAHLSDDPFAWTRIAIWKSAAAMALDHPLAGIGIGQYELVSPRYAFPVTSHWAKYTRVAESAHNDYLQEAAELGFPGLILMLALAGTLALAVARAVRAGPPALRGQVAPLAAGLAAIATHAAVDFPLRTPPEGLLVLLLALGLRMNGVTGPAALFEVRMRRAYTAAVACAAALAVFAAVRPVAGFWFFLRGIGAPANLLREKWALEEAPRRPVPEEEAIRLLGLAASVDWFCASYHRALGGKLFQQALAGGGTGRPGQVERALYQINLATALSPDNYRYFVNLGEAMTTLARLSPDPGAWLRRGLGAYRQAAALAPWSYPVYERIGALADEVGETGAAERAFRRAVAIEEFYLRGWHNLGLFLARHGRAEEARATLRRGAALAERARTLVPTSENERELIAVPADDFYNALETIGRDEPAEGTR